MRPRPIGRPSRTRPPIMPIIMRMRPPCGAGARPNSCFCCGRQANCRRRQRRASRPRYRPGAASAWSSSMCQPVHHAGPALAGPCAALWQALAAAVVLMLLGDVQARPASSARTAAAALAVSDSWLPDRPVRPPCGHTCPGTLCRRAARSRIMCGGTPARRRRGARRPPAQLILRQQRQHHGLARRSGRRGHWWRSARRGRRAAQRQRGDHGQKGFTHRGNPSVSNAGSNLGRSLAGACNRAALNKAVI